MVLVDPFVQLAVQDLRDVIDWVAEELHASCIALNPLHAIHNRRPFNTSPYLPNCIFYQNFIYLDAEGMEDFGRSRRALVARQSAAVQREIEELRAGEFVEYERVSALKLRLKSTSTKRRSSGERSRAAKSTAS